MRYTCVFDINETLLDLGGLDSRFEAVLGDAGARSAWFQQLLQSAMVSTITDEYVEFGAIGRAALTMVARRRGVELPADRVEWVISGLTELAPHAEVPAALERLAGAGVPLAALGNSRAPVIEAQLAHAGLGGVFQQVISADAVGRLKPAREPYLFAAERLGVAPHELLLVAAHSWDVTGAARAGCAAAFVARPGMVLDPLAPSPAIVAPDIAGVADALLR